MDHKIADAKQHFSAVIRDAAREPQIIYNRDEPVAAVIDVASLREFLRWRAERARQSLGTALAEARRIAVEEDYTLEVPPRADRENPLVSRGRKTRPEPVRAPRRHKRPQ